MRVHIRLALLTLLLALWMLPGTAQGSVDWCEKDPQVQIGDQMVNIAVAVPISQVNNILGGTVGIVVSIPHDHPSSQVLDVPGGLFNDRVVVIDSPEVWHDG